MGMKTCYNCYTGESCCYLPCDVCASRYDYVEVFDGNSADSKLLGRHCGNEVRSLRVVCTSHLLALLSLECLGSN